MAEQQRQMDEILDKLAKLHALEDGAATQGEAEAASAAITRLLTRYNLDALDVRRRLGNQAAPLQFGQVRLTGIKSAWERTLLGAIARHNQSQAVFWTYGESSGDVTLFGPANTLPLIEEMFRTLARTVDHLTDLGWAAVTMVYTTPGKWKTAYRLGCVSGINTALQRARDAAVEQVEQGSALVVQQEEALAQEVEQQIGKTRSMAKVTFEHTAYAQGYYDGVEVNVASRGDLKGAN